MPQNILSVYQQKIVPEAWLLEAYKHGWFKVFVPKSLGGLELPLAEGLQVLYNTAARHGGLGWAVNLGAGAGYFAGCFREEVARSIYGSEHAVIAGSGAPTGTASPQANGYWVSGEWNYCSGSAHATAFTVTATLPDGSVRSFVLLPEQVSISDQWSGFGLKPASSFTITATNALVTIERGFDVNTRISFNAYAVYHIPFLPFARLCMAATLSGIADCYIQYLHEMNGGAQQRIAETLNLLSQTNKRLHNLWHSIAVNYDNGTISSGQIEQSDFAVQTAALAKELHQLACAVYYDGGMPMADEQQPVHWAWRDVLMACQHFLLK